MRNPVGYHSVLVVIGALGLLFIWSYPFQGMPLWVAGILGILLGWWLGSLWGDA